MATRHKEAAPPPNYLQEMVMALSTPALPGGSCFRPFERERLIGLWRPNEAQKARMAELAARLSEQDTKRAMLEIMWAWPRENALYQIAPPLALGHCLQDVLLEEASQRGMLRITCRPAQDGSEKGPITSYHPIDRSAVERAEHEDASKAQREDKYHALLGGMTMGFIRSLPEIEHCACRLFLAGLSFSDWQMQLLPIEDRELLRRSLPCELIERIEAARSKVRENAPEKGFPAEDNTTEDKAAKDEAPKQEKSCYVYLARLFCAEYRWLQSQVENEPAVESMDE